MDHYTYNYTPNGIDYDPDLLYPRPDEGRGSRREENAPGPRSQERNNRENPSHGARNSRMNSAAAAQQGARERTSQRERQPRPRVEADESRERQREQNPGQVRGEKRPAKPKREPIAWKELGIVKFFTDRRTRAVFGVALICVAVYIVIAAISYFRTGGIDQSLVAGRSAADVVAAGEKVSNSGGPLGASLAETVFTQGLGIGSLVLLVYLTLLGLGLMGIRKCNFWSVTFKSLLVGITLSMVLGLVTIWCETDLNLGGYHGQYMNLLIISYADWIGAVLVSCLLLIAVLYVYLNDINRLVQSYLSLRAARKARAEELALEREEQEARVREAMQKSDLTSEPESEEKPSRTEHPRDEFGFDDTAGGATDRAADPDAIIPGTNEDSRPHRGATLNEILNGGFTRKEASASQETAVSDLPAAEETAAPAAMETPETVAVAAGEAVVPSVDDDFGEAEKAPEDTAGADEAAGEVTKEEPKFDVYATKMEEGAEKSPDLYDPTAELSHYVAPTLDLLHERPMKTNNVDLAEQEENKLRIIETLEQYNIAVSQIEATVGPTVTLYEIKLAEGVRIATIKRLQDDIAMSLAALGIRIIAPIPGKDKIGIEVPNKDPQTVSIRSVLGSKAFQECNMKLPMAMGATIANDVYIADLTKMPHLLVAGATGMGKSVGLNTIIASLLYKKHPSELKFVLIDPKMVEFSLYSVLERHFLAKLPDEEEPVVTNMDKVVRTLNSLCVEMDDRYKLLKDANVRSIGEYNERFIQKRLNPEKGHRYLPYIVMIVDEFCDLIMTAGKQVETPIARIAQKARAVGMHMIVATQRPSTNVITGIIKANFPGRIAFRVTQMVDSRTILDCPGANQLIGRGDMLFSHNGSMERVQCAFIDTDEVEAICHHIDQQVGYEHAYYLPEPMVTEDEGVAMTTTFERDTLFEEAAALVVQTGVASTSNLQRRYNIGYNRAGRIMDQLEAAGIVGPAQGSKPRQVLVDSMQLGTIISGDR